MILSLFYWYVIDSQCYSVHLPVGLVLWLISVNADIKSYKLEAADLLGFFKKKLNLQFSGRKGFVDVRDQRRIDQTGLRSQKCYSKLNPLYNHGELKRMSEKNHTWNTVLVGLSAFTVQHSQAHQI